MTGEAEAIESLPPLHRNHDFVLLLSGQTSVLRLGRPSTWGNSELDAPGSGAARVGTAEAGR